MHARRQPYENRRAGQTASQKEYITMENNEPSPQDKQLMDVQDKGLGAKFVTYTKLSGPGWLQGAITLGGGSLAGALYLGVIAGFGMLWLQPLAMICGIIMLAAIAYVTLSTEGRPFGLINKHLSPALGWAWVIATVMANIVWCMPQFNLARAAVQQNLTPAVGESNLSTIIICLVLLVTAFGVNILYESGGRGVKIFDRIIKCMVGVIVLSFFAVVVTLFMSGTLEWGRILAGLIPDPSLLFKPAATFTDLIAQSSQPEWWTVKILDDQRDIMITAFGTAVGINMTWLLPYSLLKKRWGRKHRGLAIYDLSIGLFIPFFIATSCVVIASASQFHAKTGDVLPGAGDKTVALIAKAFPDSKTNDADEQLALMIVKRDNFQLATTLEPLAGKVVSQKIFGIGVLGMALSTIIILMLMNGLAFQELLGAFGSKNAYFLGCAVSGLAGFAGPFLWGNGAARAALAIPTSVIGGSLIPIAYFTFLLMMNSKKILGEHRPKGMKRVIWNVLMIFATSIASFGSVWVLSNKAQADGWKGMIPAVGLGLLALLFIIGIVSFIRNESKKD
jgi:Mn2+/Fe2+ NRAMP family transporter